MSAYPFVMSVPFVSAKAVIIGILLATAFLPLASLQAQNDNSRLRQGVIKLPWAENTKEPILDRWVSAVSNAISNTINDSRKNHFFWFLIVANTLYGSMTGILAAMLATRFADQMSVFEKTRKTTSLITGGIGLGIAVLFVVMEVPINSAGRLTYLALAMICAAAPAWALSMMTFVILRQRRLRIAQKEGYIHDSGRLRVR